MLSGILAAQRFVSGSRGRVALAAADAAHHATVAQMGAQIEARRTGSAADDHGTSLHAIEYSLPVASGR